MGLNSKVPLNRAAQRGGAVKSFITFVAGLAFLAFLALAAGGYLAWREATSPGPSVSETIVLLEPGASVGGIATQLEQEGVIRYPELFKAAVRFKDHQGDLKAGEYSIPAGASIIDIIEILVEGKSILHYFTAPEGLTTEQILRLITEDEVLVGDVTMAPAEGEMLPETYAFTRNETRDAMIVRMMAAQDEVIASLWDGRQMDLPISTPEEAIILASIVEKETGVRAERPRVAAVFINRLKRTPPMRLESDPTVIYGLTGGEPLGRGLRVSELRGKTPYNTYEINGLPPTPIANPGRASIEAVLHPDDTDELFFVADGTGGHAFAKTLREHQQNVAAWRRIERERAQAAENEG